MFSDAECLFFSLLTLSLLSLVFLDERVRAEEGITKEAEIANNHGFCLISHRDS